MFDFLWSALSDAEEATYTALTNALSLLPASARDRLSATMPYWQDKFAPGVYFAPPPFIPPETGLRHCHWIYKVWGAQALHLLPLTTDAKIEGVVKGLEPFNPNYAWRHQTFYLDPADKRLLNKFSPLMSKSWPKMENCIKCETPPNESNLPFVGECVTIYGPFCIDLAWGWTDIAVRAWERI